MGDSNERWRFFLQIAINNASVKYLQKLLKNVVSNKVVQFLKTRDAACKQ